MKGAVVGGEACAWSLGEVVGRLHDKILQAHRLVADFSRKAMERADKAGLLKRDTPYRGVVLVLFPRALKAFNAIGLLCDAGLGEDALVLTRTLINVGIDLSYISVEDREQRARRWWWFYGVAAYQEVTRHPRPDDLSDVAEIKELSDEVVRRIPDLGRGSGWAGLTIAARARQSGLDSEYWYKYQYWYLSGVEHSDALGTASIIPADARERRPFEIGPSPAFVYWQALEAAFPMFLHITDLAMAAFDLPEKQEIPGLRERYQQLLDQVREGGETFRT